MSRKQWVALFISQLAPYIVATALLSLLPIYVRGLGLSAMVTGLYLALVFAALALGTWSSGWLAARFKRHKPFIVWGNLLCAPAVLLIGHADNIALLTLFSCAVWFLGGIHLTMVNILAGLHTREGKRGRSFGILGTAPILAGLIGGLPAGYIVNLGGFVLLFAACALLYLVIVPATLILEDKAPRTVGKPGISIVPDTGFTALFIAGLLLSVANFITGLGRPLVMDILDFDAVAITSTIAIGSAVNLPLPFVMGWLSDRYGRKTLLMVCYVAVALGVVLLAGATSLWHFWLSQTFISFVRSERVIGAALVMDTTRSDMLNIYLARFNAASWIGAVIGYTFSGLAIELMGINFTLAIGAVLPLVAMMMLLVAHPRRVAVAV